MKANNQKGFTLVELLISISIITIIQGALLKMLLVSIENNSISSARTKTVSAAQGVIEICKCSSIESLAGNFDEKSGKSIICFYNSESDILYDAFKNCSKVTDGINTESFSSLKNMANRNFDIAIRAVISVYEEKMIGITITAWDKNYGEKSMVKLVTIRRKDL